MRIVVAEMLAIITGPVIDFIGVAVPTLALLGLALEFSFRIKAPVGHTLVAASCGILVSLYLSALVGLLPAMRWIILVVGLYALVCAIDRRRTGQIDQFRDPVVVAFAAGCAVIFIATRGTLLVVWDEFSHWGAVVKFVLGSDRLARLPGELMFPSYPVGEAMFVYFITKFVHSTEGNWLYAHGVLQYAAALVLLANLSARAWFVALPLLAIALCGGYFFAEAWVNWTSLLVDTQISYLFGAALVIMFVGRGSVASLACLVPIVAALPIIKEVGLVFAAVVLVLLILDRMLVALWVGHTIRQIPMRQFWLVVAVALLPLALVAAWSRHLAAIGARPVFDTSWPKIQKRIMEPDFQATLLTVLQKSVSIFDGSVLLGNAYTSLATWLIILTGVTVVAIATQRSLLDRNRIVLMYFGMIGLVFVNAILVVYHYVVAFTPFEAVNFASFGRYMGPVLIAAFFLMFGAAVHDLVEGARRYAVAVALVGLFAVQMIAVGGPVGVALAGGPRADDFSKKITAVRQTVRERIATGLAAVPSQARVYAIWNNTSGLEFYMALFELKPRRTNAGCFSIGPQRSPSDVWSCNWTLDEFRAHMKVYDYFFVGHADDVFWSTYETLFDRDARANRAAFYRVDRRGPDLRLVPL